LFSYIISLILFIKNYKNDNLKRYILRKFVISKVDSLKTALKNELFKTDFKGYLKISLKLPDTQEKT